LFPNRLSGVGVKIALASPKRQPHYGGYGPNIVTDLRGLWVNAAWDNGRPKTS
jgi:hypothetical protein